MKWIIDNWSLLVTIVMVVIYFVLSGKKSVLNWLLYAVSMAESDFGSGTGKLKLAQVYYFFVDKYPILSKILPFTVFCALVDQALKEMRKMMENNLDIKAAITMEDEP